MKLTLALLFTFFALPSLCQSDSSQLMNYNGKNYKIEYPSTWSIDTSKMMGSDFFLLSPLEDGSDRFRENVNLMVQDLAGKGIDMDKYVEISEDQVNRLSTDGKISESKRIQTGKATYHKMIFEMKQGVFNLKIEQFYFIENEKAYVLTFTAESAKFDSFKSVGEKILDSFTLNN